MSHTEVEIVIAVVIGLFSGLISEIGGSGGLFALPMMVTLGLEPTVANATNRIQIMTLYSFAYVEYRRTHKVLLKHAFIYAIPIICGAVLGAYLASITSNEAMHWIIIFGTALMVAIAAYAPEMPVTQTATTNALERFGVKAVVLMFVVGVYAGYIEQVMAFFIYFVLVKLLDVEIETAKGLRFFLSMILTPFALIVFIFTGHIDWILGLSAAFGSSFGGWIGAYLLEKLSSENIKRMIVLSLWFSLLYLCFFVIKHFTFYGSANI